MIENLKKYGINEDIIRGMAIAAKLIKTVTKDLQALYRWINVPANAYQVKKK